MLKSTQQDPDTRFSAEELVRVRRMLMTAGEYVDCPRCGSSLKLRTVLGDKQEYSCYVLDCNQCHCSVTVGNVPEDILIEQAP